ncbi:hypothetical protein [Lachnotalea glycerini]|uniref:DUF4386 family protein n=1 Tax=Lachnotalea glycerini TaxID=1763509 RepID=A0A371JC82_9FIRM|nr:hypothetical protein [Lachnotalea glycerini]RDY30276.1 hypothetical protein CG710_015510 [Lachnotalea glycerini]
MSKFNLDIYKEQNKAMTVRERSILKFGAIFTVISAILYFIITVMIVIDPVGMYISGGEGFETLLNNPYINIGWRALFALQNIISIIVIRAFTLYVAKGNDKHYGLLSFCNIIMTAGVFIAAINWVHFIEVTKIMLNQYQAGISMDIITGIHYFPIDSFFLWTWGMYGLGFLCTNLIALITGKFSKKMGILGIICGSQLILLVIFYIKGASIQIAGVPYSLMMLCAGLLGGITGPIFMFSCKKYYLAGHNAMEVTDESISYKLQS